MKKRWLWAATLLLVACSTTFSATRINLATQVRGILGETNGGTAQSTYVLGDTLYSDGADSLAKLSGNITTTKKFLSQTGNGSVSAAPVWDDVNFTNLIGTATDAQIPNTISLDNITQITTRSITSLSGTAGKSQLPSSVAYEDEVNTFTQNQTVQATLTVEGLNAFIISDGTNTVNLVRRTATYSFGFGVEIGSGAGLVVGSGEAAGQVGANVALEGAEVLYLAADPTGTAEAIRFITGLQAGWASRVDAMVIRGDGNVGIGVASPSVDLDVSGVINASTGYRVAGAAASGNVLRGNATNFVSAQLNFSDLAGSATDAQVPNTITLDNLTQITTRNFTAMQGSVTDAQVPNTITLSNITQITTRNFSNMQGLVSDGQLANNYGGVGACGANQFETGDNDNAAPSCSQPSFSNLSGSATDAQIPNTISLNNLTQITTRNFSAMQGSVTDAQVPNTITLSNITQITTRPITSLTGTANKSQLPSAVAYEDETNTFTSLQTFTGNLKIGSSGAAITDHLSGTSTINFASIPGNGCGVSTFTITGAAVNDVVALGVPSTADAASVVYWAFVSSANSVSIKACNVSTFAINPASGTFRADVWQH